MSKQDNLLKADGIEEIESNEVETSKNDSVNKEQVKPEVEAVEETLPTEETIHAENEIKPKAELTESEASESETNDAENKTEVEIEEVEEETVNVEDDVKSEVSKSKEVQSKSDDVVNEIESSNAEDAEDEGNKDRHTIEQKEYEKMSLDSLIIELEKLVKMKKHKQ